MVQLATIVAVVTSACSVFGSVSHVPAQDQYKTRGVEDEQPHQQLRFDEATDYQFPDVQHRFGPLLRKIAPDFQKRSQSFVPELQVGCGEGFTEPRKRARRRRSAERKNPFYFTPPLSSYSSYKPQAFQIRKPYYIPVWGAPGKIPLFFPPQPILVNPGYPPDNPRGSRYPPKGYLPPGKPTRPDLEDRFMETDDDAPIWDTEESATQRPLTTTAAVPTRRTRRPGQTKPTFPPLVHNEVARNETFNNLAAQAPPMAAFRPPTTTVTPQTAPSRCVWAIISCCAASSADVSYACFEQLGCSGAFWDNSPCDNEFARAAIDSAMKYYDSAR